MPYGYQIWYEEPLTEHNTLLGSKVMQRSAMQSQSEVKLFGPRALVKAANTVSDVGDDLFSDVNKALDVLRRYCSF